jgi:hypothetical protein
MTREEMMQLQLTLENYGSYKSNDNSEMSSSLFSDEDFDILNMDRKSTSESVPFITSVTFFLILLILVCHTSNCKLGSVLKILFSSISFPASAFTIFSLPQLYSHGNHNYDTNIPEIINCCILHVSCLIIAIERMGHKYEAKGELKN